jgi:outer membrane lipopolysaccharide assembly protein LptE/RlpB
MKNTEQSKSVLNKEKFIKLRIEMKKKEIEDLELAYQSANERARIAEYKLQRIKEHLISGIKASQDLRIKGEQAKDKHATTFHAGAISEMEWILELHYKIKN